MFLQEMRKDSPAIPEGLDAQVDKTNAALERLLRGVPEEDLDKGREVVDVLKGASNVPGKDARAEGQGGGKQPRRELSAEEAEAAKRLEGLI